MNSMKIIFNDYPVLAEYQVYLIEDEKSNLTLEAYLRDIKQFLDFLCKDLMEIIKMDLIQFKQDISTKFVPETVQRKLAAIRSFCSWLNDTYRRDKIIDINVKMPKIQRKQYINDDEFLYWEDAMAMIKAAKEAKDYRAALIMKMFIHTGLRVSEQLSLTPEDVENPSALIKGKGAKYRDAFFPDCLKPYIKDYLKVRSERGDKLFTGERGNITRQTVDRIIKKYAKIAGVAKEKAHAHNFRHLCGFLLVQNRVPITDVADILGHSDINTTRIYARATKSQLYNALNNIGDTIREQLIEEMNAA